MIDKNKLYAAIKNKVIVDDKSAVDFLLKEKQREELISEIKVLIPQGEKGDKGEQGNPGINGIDGTDGKDGKDGKNGKDGENAVVDTNSIAQEASNRAIEAVKPLIPNITQLSQQMPVLGAEIRDSLELLQGEERLDRTAIRGLDDLFKTTQNIVGGGSIARNIYQLFDVGISAPTNSQVLTYNSTTHRWENQTLTIPPSAYYWSRQTTGDGSPYLYPTTANDNLYIGGNVGIGVTAPDVKLHVVDTGYQLKLGYDAVNAWTEFRTDTDGYLTIYPAGQKIFVLANLLPTNDDSVDLGGFSNQWSHLWTTYITSHTSLVTMDTPVSFAAGYINIGGGGNVIDMNFNSHNVSGAFYAPASGNFVFNDCYLVGNGSSNINFTANLIPVSDSTYNLGSASFRWNYLYVNNISADSGTVTFGSPVSLGGQTLDMANGSINNVGSIGGAMGGDVYFANNIQMNGHLISDSGSGYVAFGSQIRASSGIDMNSGYISDSNSGTVHMGSNLDLLGNTLTDSDGTLNIGCAVSAYGYLITSTGIDVLDGYIQSSFGDVFMGDSLNFNGHDIKNTGITGSSVVVTNSGNDLVASAVTAIELGYLSGIGGTPPSIVASVDLTGQTAAIGATTAFAVVTAGQYRLTWIAKVTTVGSVSSVLGGAGGFQVKYTDQDDSVVVTTGALANENTLALNTNTTQTIYVGTIMLNCKASTNLQYLMDYTSVGTAMQYNLHIRIEKI